MSILITGSAGFLGTHLIDEINRRGIQYGHYDLSDGNDIRDPEAVMAAVEGHTTVIHLAGMLGTDELFDTVSDAIDINIKGTANILQACLQHHAGFVGITMPQCWDNIYQATKGAALKIAHAYNRHYGVPVSHVRAFNAYGEGQHLKPVQKIIPTFSDRAWRGLPIPIWGDGTNTVDMIYAGDIGRMLADAITFGDREIFDAGTGQPMTVNDIANLILTHTGSQAGIEHLPMRRGEHQVDIAASGEGWTKLDWQPTFDGEAFTRTVNSYR